MPKRNTEMLQQVLETEIEEKNNIMGPRNTPFHHL